MNSASSGVSLIHQQQLQYQRAMLSTGQGTRARGQADMATFDPMLPAARNNLTTASGTRRVRLASAEHSDGISFDDSK